MPFVYMQKTCLDFSKIARDNMWGQLQNIDFKEWSEYVSIIGVQLFYDDFLTGGALILNQDTYEIASFGTRYKSDL